MSQSKRKRSYSGTAWQPVQPSPSRLETRRGYLILRERGEKSPARRALPEEALGTVERKKRQR